VISLTRAIGVRDLEKSRGERGASAPCPRLRGERGASAPVPDSAASGGRQPPVRNLWFRVSGDVSALSQTHARNEDRGLTPPARRSVIDRQRTEDIVLSEVHMEKKVTSRTWLFAELKNRGHSEKT
jgi:hypothetical protein